VARKKKHALVAGQGSLVVLKALLNHRLRHVLAAIPREQANLADVATERGKDAVKNLLAFSERLLRKREFEIAHAHATQLSVEEIHEPSYRDPGRSGEGPRQSTYKLEQSPRQRVFESVAQGKADGSRGEISVSNAGRGLEGAVGFRHLDSGPLFLELGMNA